MVPAEDVDVLCAVDAAQPFAHFVFVPIPAENVRSTTMAVLTPVLITHLTESDILDESENSDSVGLA